MRVLTNIKHRDVHYQRDGSWDERVLNRSLHKFKIRERSVTDSWNRVKAATVSLRPFDVLELPR